MNKTYTLEELRKMKGRTNIDRFEKTSEKEIREQSMADPDTPYLTEDEVKEFDTPRPKDKGHEK